MLFLAAAMLSASVHLAGVADAPTVPSATDVTLDRRQESPGPAGFAMRMGAMIDLVTSCSGHVLLAFLEDDRLNAALTQIRQPMTIPESRLRERLRQVRSRGYETQASVRTAGVTDTSFPVFAYDGRVMAALTIPYLLLIDGSQTVPLDLARERLRTASQRVSLGLGWSI